jgi:hypothetical protein
MRIREATLMALFAAACDRGNAETEARLAKLEAEQERLVALAGAVEQMDARVTRLEEAPASPSAPTGGEPIGVAECDEYVASAKRCITSKMPDDMKGEATATVDAYAVQWRQAAQDPAQRSTLVETCKKALALSKTAYASLGCEL